MRSVDVSFIFLIFPKYGVSVNVLLLAPSHRVTLTKGTPFMVSDITLGSISKDCGKFFASTPVYVIFLGKSLSDLTHTKLSFTLFLISCSVLTVFTCFVGSTCSVCVDLDVS
jgi:hypothetical protein